MSEPPDGGLFREWSNGALPVCATAIIGPNKYRPLNTVFSERFRDCSWTVEGIEKSVNELQRRFTSTLCRQILFVYQRMDFTVLFNKSLDRCWQVRIVDTSPAI